MPTLFDPITLGGVTFANRAWLSSMCMYSCEAGDGVPTQWQLVHLGSRAVGGFGLVMTEASAVLPEGRISPQDAGIWNETQAAAWAPIVDFVHRRGARMGAQLAHAGRKASARRPFPGEPRGPVDAADGGWRPVAPSALAYPGLAEPQALTEAGIVGVIDAFAAAARRAVASGFDVVEVHAAHGYLLHEFLSPLSNQRTDGYGGDLAGRSRLLLEVVDAVRAAWPAGKPLFVRISASEWTDGGFGVEEATEVARLLGEHGADLVHVSSGGNVLAPIPAGPGYQVPLAAAVRSAGLPVCAVGLITDPRQAQKVLDDGSADAVALARVALREPAWPLRAAAELECDDCARYPDSYLRGRWPAAEPVR